jgi:hypothetical protein
LISASTARIASSIALKLVPSGPLTLTSNSASSTLPGMNSCRTKGKMATKRHGDREERDAFL